MRNPRPRERAVWEAMAQGLSNRAIAERQGKSLKTVENTINRLFKSLDIHYNDQMTDARVLAALRLVVPAHFPQELE